MTARLIYSIILLFLLVNCTSESLDALDPTQGQEQGTPVQFYYTIEDREDSTVTRAVNESNRLADGSKIGIWALWWKQKNEATGDYIYINNPGTAWDNVNIRNGFKNACYVAKTESTVNGNTTTYQYLFKPEEGTEVGTIPDLGGLRVFAYYPYQTDLYNNYISPNMPKIDVKAESSYLNTHDASEIEDYLYTGPIEATAENGTINLTFKHAMAQIQVYVRTTNANWQNAMVAPRINKLTLTTTYQIGKMELETGNFIPSLSDISSQEYNLSHKIGSNYGTSPMATFLVFPEATTEKDQTTVLSLDANISAATASGAYDEGKPNSLFFMKADNTITISKGKITKVYITINKIN